MTAAPPTCTTRVTPSSPPTFVRRACVTVVIAHRPATIRGADRIAVLGKGRITEEGAWITEGGAWDGLAPLTRPVSKRDGPVGRSWKRLSPGVPHGGVQDGTLLLVTSDASLGDQRLQDVPHHRAGPRMRVDRRADRPVVFHADLDQVRVGATATLGEGAPGARRARRGRRGTQMRRCPRR
ncbi:hypothetical protein GCM10010383_78960 [Streptomyces lomondensis]|uniref:Uncharacterized protein n=1 Tax=Streptomyces lomondensis TaxID=68229 RepID=A0ABQ2XY81_9ACTN|nr:hypothetical protein GCM10010383_78960 [Streptomyces lomondensis]